MRRVWCRCTAHLLRAPRPATIMGRYPRRFAVLATAQVEEPNADVGGNVEGRQTAVVLHGILGNKANLRTFTKHLAQQNPRWRFLLMDHRGHGDSPSPGPPQTVHACAKDVLETVDSLGAPGPSAIIGHSFGGKVALEASRQLLLDRGFTGPLHTWMLDSVPGVLIEDMDSSQSVSSVMARVESIAMPVASKDDLIRQLETTGLATNLAQWMTTNLRSNPGGGYTWRFDVPIARALFEEYKGKDYHDFLSALPKSSTVGIVTATRNNIWKPEVVKRIEAASESSRNNGGGFVHMHSVDSGHWVHIEAMRLVLELLQSHTFDTL